MYKFTTQLRSMSLAEKKALFKQSREQYYNDGNSTLTDAEFDALEDSIRERAPNWIGLKSTGTKVKAERIGKKTETVLDVPMPSLDKIQAGNTKALAKFVTDLRGVDAVLSEKLDGSSIQAVYRKGQLVKLATRGDGTTGKDISYFIPFVKLPKTIDKLSKTVVRLEAVMPMAVYQKKWVGEYDSARALSSAILNRQDVAPALHDLDFVALRLMEGELTLSEGFHFLESQGFKVVKHIVVKSKDLENDTLVETLSKIRSKAKYETDGLVIFSNAARLSMTGDRPKYAKAFKVNDEENAPTTKIVDIKWQPSRHGTLVPKAIIEPIQFGGVTVKQAALHNAKWAMDRGCGIGAVVKVLRSGDIIPKIVAVVNAKRFFLPSSSAFGEYAWDATQTSLVLKEKSDSREVLIRTFSNFFAKLDLEQMSGGLAEKIVDAGVEHTWQLPLLREEFFAGLPGVKKMAATYAKQMARVQSGDFNIIQLMLASGCFDKGVGETRLQTMFAAFPNPDAWESVDEDAIANTRGCGPAFAKSYLAGLPKFVTFLRKSHAKIAKIVQKRKVEGKLTGVMGSWTGYRSAVEEEVFEANGGTVVPFGSKTTVLFFKANGKSSSKVDKAKEKGIKTSDFAVYMKGIK